MSEKQAKPLWKYEDYNDWSRMMAKQYTLKELENMVYGTNRDLSKSKTSHLNAVIKSNSMGGNGQARAQSRNSMTGAYEKKYAIENAMEIYKFYPEFTKGGIT